MCCLRYEHDFYVQSRRRFPKEGRVVTTSKGEEKIVAIDIFSERITLRLEDGESRTVLLSEFKLEANADSFGASAPPEEEETRAEQIRAEDISPELIYTAEHEVPLPRAEVLAEPQAVDRDAGSKRRRGRRGGRRGRGGNGDAPGGNTESTGGQE